MLIEVFTLKLLGHPTPLLQALNKAITATKAKSLKRSFDLRVFIRMIFKF